MVRATSHGTRERCKVKHVTRLFALSIFDDAMDDDSNVITSNKTLKKTQNYYYLLCLLTQRNNKS